METNGKLVRIGGSVVVSHSAADALEDGRKGRERRFASSVKLNLEDALCLWRHKNPKEG